MRLATTTSVQTVSPESFQGWSKLEPNEQNKLVAETQALEKAANSLEMSTLEVGEHLDNINRVLSPRRQFNKWLLWWLKGRKKAKSRSWAYQAMAEYQALQKSIPKPVLEMAKANGTRLKPTVIAHNPPPTTTDKGAIASYLSNLKTTRIEVVKSSDMLLKEVVNFFVSRYDQLPNNHKTRAAFVRSVIGMIMAKAAISTQAFEPMAIPETFKVQRGRPPLPKAA